MNICFITRSFPFGKGEAFVIPEIMYTQNAGNRVSVVPLRPEGDVVHRDSITLLDFTLKQPLCDGAIIIGAIREICRNPAAFVKLLRVLCRSRNSWVFIKNLAVVSKALWLAGYLRHTGVPDHIHVHWLSTTATMAMITASLLKVPWSITAHRWDIAENNLIKEKVESCSFVRCVNENGATEIRNIVGETEKIQTLHIGVEIPDEILSNQKKRDEDRIFRILMPANFVEVKGHTYLIQAIHRLQMQGEEIQVDLAGEGELKDEIQEQASQMGLTDCIHFLGEISHSILLNKLFSGEWDCVTLPSILTSKGEKEGIPVSLIEAMAAGVPVVSTLTGGIPELCTPGTAFLVPEKDPQALSEALLSLIHDLNKR
ncbi:MAG TPA: glycosyltransferase, partial [Negativicutes bacterium]|nr:glycosyltransferase [Negativicutes bacterium]